MKLCGEECDALVVGGSKGVGAAIVEQLARQPWRRIFVASRTAKDTLGESIAPQGSGAERVAVNCDISDESSLAATAEFLRAQNASLALICCTVGMLHDETIQPEKSLGQCNAGDLQRAFAINSIGPLMVAKHLSRFLPKSRESLIVNFSARVGSIDDNRAGGWYGYRASKAAQNMITKNIAVELGRKLKQNVCVAYHPGTVKTDLSKPFLRKGSSATVFSPERAAEYFMALVENLSVEDSGHFFDWNGKEIRW